MTPKGTDMTDNTELLAWAIERVATGRMPNGSDAKALDIILAATRKTLEAPERVAKQRPEPFSAEMDEELADCYGGRSSPPATTTQPYTPGPRQATAYMPNGDRILPATTTTQLDDVPGEVTRDVEPIAMPLPDLIAKGLTGPGQLVKCVTSDFYDSGAIIPFDEIRFFVGPSRDQLNVSLGTFLPLPHGTGWIRNTGTAPDCERVDVAFANGEIWSQAEVRRLSWAGSGDRIAFYRPAEPAFKSSRATPDDGRKKWGEWDDGYGGHFSLQDHFLDDDTEIRVKRTGDTFSIKRRRPT